MAETLQQEVTPASKRPAVIEMAIAGVPPVTAPHYTDEEWAEYCRRRDALHERERRRKAESRAVADAKMKAHREKRRKAAAKGRATYRRKVGLPSDKVLTQRRRAAWVFLVERAVEMLTPTEVESELQARETLRTWPEWAAVMETLPRPGRQVIALSEAVVETVLERRGLATHRGDSTPIQSRAYGPPLAPPPLWPLAPPDIPRNGCRWVGARRFLPEWENCVDWGEQSDTDFGSELETS